MKIKKAASKKSFETANHNRGTTQIAYLKYATSSGSSKPYAFTQQSREEPTGGKLFLRAKTFEKHFVFFK